MHGFINSPALAKLVALQMVDEERRADRGRSRRPSRTGWPTRLLARRTSRSPGPTSPASRLPRTSRTGTLAEDV